MKNIIASALLAIALSSFALAAHHKAHVKHGVKPAVTKHAPQHAKGGSCCGLPCCGTGCCCC